MLFLRGAQVVLWSSVLTVLDLDEVNVMLKNAEISGSVLSGEGWSANGWRCCCWGAPGVPHLPPAAPKNPPPFIASLLLFCFAEMGPTSTASGRPTQVSPFWSEKRGGKSHLGMLVQQIHNFTNFYICRQPTSSHMMFWLMDGFICKFYTNRSNRSGFSKDLWEGITLLAINLPCRSCYVVHNICLSTCRLFCSSSRELEDASPIQLLILCIGRFFFLIMWGVRFALPV